MISEEAKKDYLESPKSALDEIALFHIEQIYDDFESRLCQNCKWCSTDFMGDICTNGDSLMCADFVKDDFGCPHFERRENAK